VEKGGKIGGGKEEEEDVPRCKEDAEHVRRKDGQEWRPVGGSRSMEADRERQDYGGR
jgi:hypothetical protein